MDADQPDPAPAATVTVYPDGPLVVRGDFALRGVDGRTLDTGRMVALCRCGRSAAKPYCDGSHQRGDLRSAARARVAEPPAGDRRPAGQAEPSAGDR